MLYDGLPDRRRSGDSSSRNRGTGGILRGSRSHGEAIAHACIEHNIHCAEGSLSAETLVGICDILLASASQRRIRTGKEVLKCAE